MNAQQLKELNEQRGAKYKDYVALSEKATLTADETKRFNDLETEIKDVDARIERAAKAHALASAKASPLSQSEERTVKQFSLLKVVQHMARAMKGQPGTLEGAEAELLQEGEKELRESGASSAGGGGITLPRVVCRRSDRSGIRFGTGEGFESRAVLSATGSSSVTGDLGGITVATTPQGLLDDFYNALVFEKAGATIVEGLRGNLVLPRYVADSDPAHKTENQAAANVTPTTLGLSLSPKRLPAYIDLSEQLLMQSEVAFEKIVRSNLSRQLTALIQKKWINGAGSSGEPSGILNASTYTLQTVYAGGATSNGTNADGLAQSYRDWTRLRTKVATQDAPLDRAGFMTNSRVIGQAMETKRGLLIPTDTTATDSRMIIDDPAVMRVAGFPVFETNGVPATLSKGASSGILSANIFAYWPDFYAAFWSGINLELVRDATYAKAGEYALVAAVYYDGGIVRTKSFAKCIDINAP